MLLIFTVQYDNMIMFILSNYFGKISIFLRRTRTGTTVWKGQFSDALILMSALLLMSCY